MQLSPSSRLEDNCHFNSRTHVECDNLGWVRFIDSAISTRALTWSATSAGWIAKKHSEISTHALTWSATELCDLSAMIRYISTHALTWSATGRGQRITIHELKFQLTHSRGVRPPRAANHDTRIEISTHVECDMFDNVKNVNQVNFNSRTHVECDDWTAVYMCYVQLFQLTHSRGVRQQESSYILLPEDFNSRTHVECDSVSYVKGSVVVISTHALTWSATRCILVYSIMSEISTHALTWSATRRRIG